MQSYIVIGGGLAGLTAANALAQPGRKVTLLEQSEHLGGRAITQLETGFELNLGPHALYCGGPATRTFTEWKIPLHGHPPATGAGYFVYEGEKYPVITGAASLLKSSLFGFAEKIEAGNLLRLFAAGHAPRPTMREWIEDHAKSPKVRDLAAAITRLTTFAADLDHLSAAAALGQIGQAFASGVAYLDHGWQTLIDGLTDRARSLNVEIRRGTPVTALPDCDGVILAVPPVAVEKLTGARFPNLRPIRVACLDLGLGTIPENTANFGLGIDRPLYLSVHSAAAKLAPEGSALIQTAKYLHAESDPAADRAELEQFADVLVTGWRNRVSMTRFLPSMTVSYAMPTTEGRPEVEALADQGVFLAGDWVGHEYMLTDTVVASALRAAAMVQKGKSARNAA
jgi:phytoene dehydrogenase-like protein